jgi:hypothetical protein
MNENLRQFLFVVIMAFALLPASIFGFLSFLVFVFASGAPNFAAPGGGNVLGPTLQVGGVVLASALIPRGSSACLSIALWGLPNRRCSGQLQRAR